MKVRFDWPPAPLFSGVFISLISLGLFAVSAGAEEDPVSVSRVQFRRDRLDGMREDWIEIEVEVAGGRNRSPNARDPRFSGRVRAVLNLAYAAGSRDAKEFRYFQCDVTIPTIEQGEKRKLFFYLPPEVIKRDRLSREPEAFLIELFVDEKAVPTRREHVSSNLSDASRVSNFRSRVSLGAKENDGILVPIFETPFFLVREKMRESPAYIR